MRSYFDTILSFYVIQLFLHAFATQKCSRSKISSDTSSVLIITIQYSAQPCNPYQRLFVIIKTSIKMSQQAFEFP